MWLLRIFGAKRFSEVFVFMDPKSKGFHIFGVLIQKVFVSFRSERFSYPSDPKGFRIFLPANMSLEFWRETG